MRYGSGSCFLFCLMHGTGCLGKILLKAPCGNAPDVIIMKTQDEEELSGERGDVRMFFSQVRKKREPAGTAVKMMEAALAVLTVLSFLKGIWVSLDMDESYAAALGYRMAAWDRLIRDMWEPHQFSGFLAAIFTAAHVRIWGSTEYLIVFLREAGVLIHTALGLALCDQLRKEL